MNNKSLKNNFWIALIGSWITFLIFLISPLFFIYWIIITIILFVKKYKYRFVLLCCNPYIVVSILMSILGGYRYFQGEAQIKALGESFEYRLDKDYRLIEGGTGCCPIGCEMFLIYPNNFVTIGLTKILGYQKNVYIGFYPSEEEAVHLIDSLGYKQKFIYKNNEILVSDKTDTKEIKYELQCNLDKYGDSIVYYSDGKNLILFKLKIYDEYKISFYDSKNKQIFNNIYIK